jgi:hypothetical protein
MKSPPNRFLQRRSLDRNVSLLLLPADVVDRHDVSLNRGDQDASRSVVDRKPRAQPGTDPVIRGTIAHLNHSLSGHSVQ